MTKKVKDKMKEEKRWQLSGKKEDRDQCKRGPFKKSRMDVTFSVATRRSW